MSLQFILGNSGSGKSTWLYEKILAEAALAPEKDFLFLVPEQFTLQTQKEFVKRHPRHAILNIDVLSFQRLAYRVFDDLGITDFAVLEETGKNLVVRKVAGEIEKDLKLLQGNIRKMGYISEVKSLISELKQYHVSLEELEHVRDSLEQKNVLWYKINDICLLYGSFQKCLEGNYITADEIVDLLTKVASESEMLKGSVVVLDGYTGFTPVQNHFLETLLPLAESIRVALTIDSKETVLTGEPNVQDLFYLSKKTVHSLYKLAANQSVEILEPIYLTDGREKRYQNAPALYHLEQNLFRVRRRRFLEEQSQIRIAHFFQPGNELRFVAGEIQKLVSEQRYRYVDIAVVTGDVAGYADYAEDIFSAYGIPLFIDQKKNILFHPMIELLRAILELEIESSNYSYESVMRFLRTGLSGFKTDDIDLLENYILAFHIRGWSMWNKTWIRPVPWLEEAELENLNEVRSRFALLFEPLHQVFHRRGHDSTIKEKMTVLYELLVSLQIPKQLEEQKKQFEASGMLARAKENEQIFGIVVNLFDKIVELLGEEQVSAKEFADLLNAGLEAAQVGIIPPGYDRVLFGDIERTRLEHIKVLFFIGVNDGIIPKSEGSKGILSEFEREKLADFQIELSPTARERSFIQKFYLYLNMTKPSEKLYLTYCNAGADGMARRCSYLIHTVEKLFPNICLESPEEEKIVTKESSMQYFLEGLDDAKEGNVKEDWKALYAWYRESPMWDKKVEEYIRAAYFQYQETRLDPSLCRALYGKVLENSVTRLERFASCAFAHFLQYGLCLAERQVSDFTPVDFGNILHDALEQFAHRMEAGGDNWFEVTAEKQETYAKEAIDAAIARCGNAALNDGARNLYLVRRMEKVILRTVDVLARQIRRGRFEPENYEVSFQSVSDLNAVSFTLGEEEKMRLRGRIDRMDRWERETEVYVKVIDYKSGATKFQLLSIYHGLQLQLVVYLNAAMELMGRKYRGKAPKPAGIFYYHIDDPILETEEELTDQEIRDKIFEKLKLDGYVNADPDIYQNMDNGMHGSSSILPIKENKDGSLRKGSNAATEQEFRALSEYVNEKIAELGKRMMDGEIGIHPYELREKTPCSYCEFKSICGFDERLAGYEYRKLEEMGSDREILDKMANGHRMGEGK